MTSISVTPTDNEIQRSGAGDMTALYWARVDGIDPSQEKPIQVTRHWRGHTVQFRCYVTQDPVDAYQARKLSIGDYVLVVFVDQDRDKPLATQRIAKTW